MLEQSLIKKTAFLLKVQMMSLVEMAENPIRTALVLQQQIEETYEALRIELGNYSSAITQTRQELMTAESEVATWSERAEQAAREQNPDAVRSCVQQRKLAEATVVELREALAHRENIEFNLQQSVQQLRHQKRGIEALIEDMRAEEASALAMNTASAVSQSDVSAFEEKYLKQIDVAQARQEVLGIGGDDKPLSSEIDDEVEQLLAKYK